MVWSLMGLLVQANFLFLLCFFLTRAPFRACYAGWKRMYDAKTSRRSWDLGMEFLQIFPIYVLLF